MDTSLFLSLTRCIPIGAFTLRAYFRLLVAITRYPFVATPFTTVAHDHDVDLRHPITPFGLAHSIYLYSHIPQESASTYLFDNILVRCTIGGKGDVAREKIGVRLKWPSQDSGAKNGNILRQKRSGRPPRRGVAEGAARYRSLKVLF